MLLREAPLAMVVPPEMGCLPTGAQGAASALLVPHSCSWGVGEGYAAAQYPPQDDSTDASHCGTGSVGVGAPCWGAGGLWAPVARHSSIWTLHTGPGSSHPRRAALPRVCEGQPDSSKASVPTAVSL